MYKFAADISRVVINLVSPLLIIFLVGMGIGDLVELPFAGPNFTEFFAAGLIAVAAMGSAIQIGVSLIRDREGAIGNLLVAPISRAALLLGKMLAELTEQGMTFLVALAIFLSSAHVPLLGFLKAIPIVALLVVGFSSFGIIASMVFFSTKAYNSFLTFVISPLIFLSGAFFPLESFPPILRVLSLLNPLTYGVDAIRAAVFGTSTLGMTFDLIVLVPFAAITFGLSWWLFEQREFKLW